MNSKVLRIVLRVAGGILLAIGLVCIGADLPGSIQATGSPLPVAFDLRFSSASLGFLFSGALLFVLSFTLFRKQV